jgi:hypothetical protein
MKLKTVRVEEVHRRIHGPKMVEFTRGLKTYTKGNFMVCSPLPTFTSVIKLTLVRRITHAMNEILISVLTSIIRSKNTYMTA